MSEAQNFDKFVSFSNVTFNIIDIITVSLEVDSIDGNTYLYINLNGRSEPLIFTEKVAELYAYLVHTINAINIDEIIDKIGVNEDAGNKGIGAVESSTKRAQGAPDPLPQEPVIRAKIVPAFTPDQRQEDEDAELDRRLNGTPKISP